MTSTIIIQVYIVNTSSQNYQKQDDHDTGELKAMFKGYIHPLGAPPVTGSVLMLYVITVDPEAVLYMSTDHQPANMVVSIICTLTLMFFDWFESDCVYKIYLNMNHQW